jgi:ubiquinone/menaquinone biosynthesis C-methylase UbiE
MNNDGVWDYFQNEGIASFDLAGPRLNFLARQLAAGERVLNIGVGSGLLERIAQDRGVDIHALDPSERAIIRLRNDLGLGDRAQTGYGQSIPFPGRMFDAVVISEVIEHLEQDILDATLDEVRRVLSPGGRLIGTVPAREDLSVSEVVCPQCSHHFHRWGHVHSFDAAQLRQLLESRFQVQTVKEQFFIDWKGAGWRRRLKGLAKRFLSDRGIGTYGVNRSLFFCAVNAS